MSEPAPAATEATVEEVIRRRIGDALGGWYGSLETALPTVAFVATWLVLDDVRTAVIASAALLTVLALVRLLVVKGSLRFLVSAVIATALAAFFAQVGEALVRGRGHVVVKRSEGRTFVSAIVGK